ncbi:S-layer homology domain-containing protein [Paenibacillus sp. UNCCL117]|uniref:S-layer homology domain-containing protein n=1 Tax=unclassified Paenibacillus TaxID=185978 RepID=UPI0008807194|nr:MULTISPECIES: S-layer homology domain-containing protein [unclassified Paenibacillus]SDC70759.1 S-layer homology domain-containing protein [Paenibacillus sp. cl123]SFW24286.1 S-layer homology domain-containing protein [Paenibacillus sp. UNCCL117]
MKHWKKGLLIAAGAAWINAQWGTGQAHAQFSDVTGHWAEMSIGAAVAANYVDGYPDGSFKPENEISRAEFVKLVASALHVQGAGIANSSSWYDGYVSGLKLEGVVRDSDFSDSNWDKAISRVEMARMAARASLAELRDPEVALDDATAMYYATRSGLIQGLHKGELALDGLTTRAQSVTVLERIMKARAGEKLPVDKYAAGRAEVALTGTNFESAYGKRTALKLPAEYSLTSDVKMTIKEAWFFDSSEKDSPVWELIEGGKRSDRKGLEDSYYFAYKAEYDMGSKARDYSVRVLDYFDMIGWAHVFTTGEDQILRLETGIKEGWIIFALSKSKSDPSKQKYNLQYSGYEINNKNHYLFADQD